MWNSIRLSRSPYIYLFIEKGEWKRTKCCWGSGCDAGWNNELHPPSKKEEREIIHVFMTVSMYICSLMLVNTDRQLRREYPGDNVYCTTQKAIKAVVLRWNYHQKCTFLLLHESYWGPGFYPSSHLVGGRSTPWTGHQPITWHAHTHTLSFTVRSSSRGENEHTLNSNPSCWEVSVLPTAPLLPHICYHTHWEKHEHSQSFRLNNELSHCRFFTSKW